MKSFMRGIECSQKLAFSSISYWLVRARKILAIAGHLVEICSYKSSTAYVHGRLSACLRTSEDMLPKE